MISHRAWRKGVFQITTLLAVVLILLIMFISAAYIVLLPGPEQPTDQQPVLDALQANRDKWSNQRPVSFRYVVHRTCFCTRAGLEPYVATEERGFKTTRFPIPFESESGETLVSPPSPMWIDDLFELIGRSTPGTNKVFVEYDHSYGFPKLIDIKQDAADGNVRYEVRDFEVLEYR